MENSLPDLLADVPLIICREMHFMHDGAPAISVSLPAST
jgi:hypothetical protein